MPPERLAEIVFPRFFGDPARNLEGVYFGWNLEDRDYPYVESIYPGLLLAVLGAVALIRWRIPRRAAWALAFLGGLFLALGRHNPLYEALREAVPVLAVLRFPEKFAVLAVLALLFAGVLGWQRLLDEREAGRAEAADLPVAMAAVVLRHRPGLRVPAAVGAAGGPLADRPPRRSRPRGAGHGRRPGLPAGGELGRGGDRRRGHRPARALPLAAPLPAPAGGAGGRPAGGRPLALRPRAGPHPAGRRLHGAAAARGLDPPRRGPDLRAGGARRRPRDRAARLGGDPRTLLARTYIARLEPYSGLLWHLPYAFNNDFDLMLTGWGRQAQRILDTEWAQPEMAYRYLGVWNVGTLLLQAPARPAPPARHSWRMTPPRR